MKKINIDDMYSVEAKGTSFIYEKCKYKNNGCNYVVKASYNNSWWCFGFAKSACRLAVALRIDFHNSACIYAYRKR